MSRAQGWQLLQQPAGDGRLHIVTAATRDIRYGGKQGAPDAYIASLIVKGIRGPGLALLKRGGPATCTSHHDSELSKSTVY